MARVSHSPRIVRFGPCELDLREGDLYKNGLTVKLHGQPLQVLAFLVKHPGVVVSREELRQELWPRGTFVDFDQGLNTTINKIREALGDSAESPRFIETHARRGYRFIAPVREERLEEPSPGADPTKKETVSARRGQAHFLIAAATLVALLVLAGYVVRQYFVTRASPAGGKVMLAILPFVNLSDDTGQEYFSDGLTEEMITQLGSADLKRLGVIARSSAMKYKNTHEDVQQIGRGLGVDYVLEGSVRRAGDRVRISAQLIQVKDRTHLWAKDYDGNMRDILALQSKVAGAIAQEIELKLTPEEHARLTSRLAVDPEAYELYLKGRYFWNKRTEDGYLKAIGYFQQAIVRNPKYAQAYAGLADTYALLGSLANLEAPRDEAMPKAKAAALNALHLDDSLAEAHTSLAFVMMQYEWDWHGSEQEFRRALQLNPNYATAHQWYAIWLMAQRKNSQALEEAFRAQQSDPLSPIIKTDTAQLLECSNDYAKAVQQAQRALEIDPNFSLAHLYLADAYVGKQDYPAATAEFQKALAPDKGDPWVLSHFARSYALAGEPHKSEVILRDLLKGAKNQNDVATELGTIYAALGKNDQAFFWLEKAYEHHSGSMVLFGVSPEYRSLRGDPRFNDLLHRVGLPADNSSIQ